MDPETQTYDTTAAMQRDHVNQLVDAGEDGAALIAALVYVGDCIREGADQ